MAAPALARFCHLFNMLGYDPAGHSPPGADPGSLFVIAWLRPAVMP